jgi:aryl sulfotransferase
VGRPVDINDLPDGGIASARGLFDYLSLIDSGLLTHDEIDALRPRVYEELARGAQDEYDAPEDAPPVRFVKAHDAYTLTPKGEPLLAGRRGAIVPWLEAKWTLHLKHRCGAVWKRIMRRLVLTKA